MDITGTSAIVTGAASGLGAATAAQLIERGAKVVGIDLPGGIEKAPQVEGLTYVAADVTNEEQVRAAVATAAEIAPLRTVVNCAGIGPSARVVGRNGVHDLALFDRVVRINLVGTFTVLALAAEVMTAQEPVDEAGQRGLVINTASVAAFEGQIGQAAYAASKGGVHSLTIAAGRGLPLRPRGVRPLPAPPGPARGVRAAGRDDRGARLPQRRDHPHGRRPAHGAALILAAARLSRPGHAAPGDDAARPRTRRCLATFRRDEASS